MLMAWKYSIHNLAEVKKKRIGEMANPKKGGGKNGPQFRVDP